MMPMPLLRLEEPRALEQAIAVLQHGGVIAYPTDTVYGIGASLQFPDALDRIYAIKGRRADAPLPVLLASSEDLAKVSPGVDPRVLELASRFWPGSLTVAVPALASLPPQVIAADGTVGVRVPAHSIALTLAQRVGGAIATTSANPSGLPPATRASEVIEALGERLDLVLDGGYSRGGTASTVIRPEGDTITIIRDGAIPAETIRDAWRLVQATARL
jgi:L-threonylcarbamoyladenylate synthase